MLLRRVIRRKPWVRRLLWSLRTRVRQHTRSLTRRCPQAIFSWPWSLRRYYLIGLVYGAVEGWGAIAQRAILHSLLELLILELRGIEGRRVIHKGGWVKHCSGGIRVEMVEASAIVILDGGVIHPGAHVCGKAIWQPICRCDHMLAIQYHNGSSREEPDDEREMGRRDSRLGAMKSRRGRRRQEAKGKPMLIDSVSGISGSQHAARQ